MCTGGWWHFVNFTLMCDPTRFLERCWNGEPLAEHEMVQLARMVSCHHRVQCNDLTLF